MGEEAASSEGESSREGGQGSDSHKGGVRLGRLSVWPPAQGPWASGNRRASLSGFSSAFRGLPGSSSGRRSGETGACPLGGQWWGGWGGRRGAGSSAPRSRESRKVGQALTPCCAHPAPSPLPLQAAFTHPLSLAPRPHLGQGRPVVHGQRGKCAPPTPTGGLCHKLPGKDKIA